MLSMVWLEKFNAAYRRGKRGLDNFGLVRVVKRLAGERSGNGYGGRGAARSAIVAVVPIGELGGKDAHCSSIFDHDSFLLLSGGLIH